MNTYELKEQLKYKIPQIRLALLREPDTEPTAPIHTPLDIEPYLEPMKHLSEENFVTLHLDVRHRIIGYHVVSTGTISASLTHPREVFKAALLSNAYTMIVAHNHPSGSSSPSDDDKETTRQLVLAGHILGIPILDHLIVTHRVVMSIRESYPELFVAQKK